MTSPYRRYGITILIALLICVYTLTNAGKAHIVDEVSLFAVTESLVLRGETDTNAIAWTQWVNSPGEVLGAFGTNGEVYSKKGPAPAFLATAWYGLLHWIASWDIHIGLMQGTLLWNGFLTAATAALLWLTATRLGYDDRTGAGLGLLFGLCTIAWPYANHFFGEPLSALSLLICFYGLLAYRQTDQGTPWLWLAGIGAGLAVATVTAHGLLIGCLILYWLTGFFFSSHPTSRKPLAIITAVFAFCLPLLLATPLLLWYNGARFGNFFTTGYHFDSGEGFTTPLGQGLWGLLVSPYRGLFWHTPLFIVSLLAFPRFLRRHRAEGILIGALSMLLVGLYSLWWMWWGGFAWGPRFLVPLSPFWVLLLAPLVAEWKTRALGLDPYTWWPTLQFNLRTLGARGWLLLSLAGFSFIVQVLAVAVNYVNYETQLRQIFPTDMADPLKFGPPAQSLADLFYSPVFGQWQLLRTNFQANTDLAWFRSDGNIVWLIVLMGFFTVATLFVALGNWWRISADDELDALPSRPIRWLTLLLPALLISIWLSGTANDPYYGVPDQGYRAILADICHDAQPSDAIVTIAPFSYHIPMNWLAGECEQTPPLFGYATNSLNHAEAAQVLGAVLQSYQRVWFVTERLPVNDPDNTVERGLSTVAYKADDRWFDDYRLLRYATPIDLATAFSTQLDTPLADGGGQQILLTAAVAPNAARAGEIIPVEIHYELEAPATSDLRWFVQLLAGEGHAVALIDSAPAHGYTPFSTLPVGEDLIERVALQLPEVLAPGQYQLIAGLYDPTAPNAARLRLPNGRDFISLSQITVQ